MPDPYCLAEDAAAELARLTGTNSHDVAMVLGSGWQHSADVLGVADAEVDRSQLPGFQPTVADGHGNSIRSLVLGDKRVLVFMGRTHYYEAWDANSVAHAVRTAAAAGAKTLILTNSSAGLNPQWVPGTPVLISDHINLTAASPLTGPRFVDLTDMYAVRLRAIARSLDVTLREGIYAQFTGPHYESPAEVHLAGLAGASMVGMSTALEAIAAREAGMEILGISLVSVLAAGVSHVPIRHADVLAVVESAAVRMGRLLAALLPLI